MSADTPQKWAPTLHAESANGYATEHWLHGTRTQQLKQCGNAVVPQQGAYALRALVSRFNAAWWRGGL